MSKEVDSIRVELLNLRRSRALTPAEYRILDVLDKLTNTLAEIHDAIEAAPVIEEEPK